MNLKNVVVFPGNYRPTWRRSEPATIIILPVIHIVRFLDKQPRMSPSKLARRLMNLRTMLRE